ncbi:MAG: peptidase M75 [Prevotella sp.]|nr:peptidase M75 [Bacteroides sp.]MCM1367127.1 peptidase M75 [Prevotella sp.]MCM1437439.1 peptidase M75 [Prevotella sp.]
MEIKRFFRTSALLLGGAVLASVALSSCSDDKEPDNNNSNQVVDSKNIDYTSENANGWHNYTIRVAELLANDSKNLYNAWKESYNGGAPFAETFRKGNSSAYPSHLSCIEEILDGCSDIANEVGEAKIGDPYTLYMAGKHDEALYAVESWYSWHSRDDYANNIISVRNSYLGSLDGSENANSMSALVKEINPNLDVQTKTLIDNARNAILAINQPFRNHINSAEAVKAQEECDKLSKHFDQVLKPFFEGLNTSYDARLGKIVENYVDVVVLPTYELLKDRNAALLQAVKDLSNSRTNEAFEKACAAWLASREPWERSEAFLFGPVDALGLDPNMDSWPLDQDAIVNILKSGNFNDLNWGDDDDDDKIESAQNIRGFHTLEFLLFKDGQPRKIN